MTDASDDDDDVAATLLRVGASRRLAPGDVLHSQGAVVDSVSIVVRGELLLALDARVSEPVGKLGAGEVVGLAAFITQEPSDAFMVAEVPTELRVVDRQTFDVLWRDRAGFRRKVLELLARQLTRLEAGDRLEELARHRHRGQGHLDLATNVLSRRWLAQALPRLVARHERDHEPLCALLLDLDHFKRFNAEHGHRAGDEALRVVATTAWSSLRVTDFLVRTGGEEFVVLLPSTTLDEGALAAERVRVAIAGAPVLAPDGVVGPVTVSVGVALHVLGAEPEAFIEAARVAKFDAKLAGRNQVAVSARRPR